MSSTFTQNISKFILDNDFTINMNPIDAKEITLKVAPEVKNPFGVHFYKKYKQTYLHFVVITDKTNTDNVKVFYGKVNSLDITMLPEVYLKETPIKNGGLKRILERTLIVLHLESDPGHFVSDKQPVEGSVNLRSVITGFLSIVKK